MISAMVQILCLDDKWNGTDSLFRVIANLNLISLFFTLLELLFLLRCSHHAHKLPVP